MKYFKIKIAKSIDAHNIIVYNNTKHVLNDYACTVIRMDLIEGREKENSGLSLQARVFLKIENDILNGRRPSGSWNWKGS